MNAHFPHMHDHGRMSVLADRIALIERVDNGLVVRYREPVETKHDLPPSPRGIHLMGQPPEEPWQRDEPESRSISIWVLEMRAAYCKDEEAVLPILRAARACVERIRVLRREGAHVVEQDDEDGHQRAAFVAATCRR